MLFVDGSGGTQGQGYGDMEIFLEKIHQLLPALGVEVLVPTGANAAATTEREILTCEIKGLKATGYRTPNGIVQWMK